MAGWIGSRRLLIVVIAASLCVLHLLLADRLGGIVRILARTLDDDEDNGGDDGDWRKLEAIKLLVSVARWSSLSSSIIALAGLVGVLRDLTGPIRVMLLNSFLSLGAELVLLAVTSLVVFSSMSSSSFSAALCEALAHSEVTGSFDLLGWSLEACEERWKGIATALTGFVAAIAFVRLWAAHQILTYYTQLTNRLRRTTHALNTSLPALYSDSPPSPSPTSSRSKGQRIFLLPVPLEVGSSLHPKATLRDSEADEVPLVAVTPSSPLTSFPPTFPTVPAVDTVGGVSKNDKKFLVYAPVMMTAEQARALQAQEVVCSPSSSSSRPRSRTHTFTSSTSQPSSPVVATPSTKVGADMFVTTTVTTVATEHDGPSSSTAHHFHAPVHLSGKGKVA